WGDHDFFLIAVGRNATAGGQGLRERHALDGGAGVGAEAQAGVRNIAAVGLVGGGAGAVRGADGEVVGAALGGGAADDAAGKAEPGRHRANDRVGVGGGASR